MKNNQRHNPQEEKGNLLSNCHNTLLNLPIRLRTIVCEECGWSVPTYYRKCRGASCSNAEKDMIARIHLQILQESITGAVGKA